MVERLSIDDPELFCWHSHFDMRRLSNRHANRRLCIAFLVLLAVVAFLRSWHQVALELPSANNGDVSISTSGAEIENPACEWQQGGPQLYMLQHTKKHPKGESAQQAGSVYCTPALIARSRAARPTARWGAPVAKVTVSECWHWDTKIGSENKLK